MKKPGSMSLDRRLVIDTEARALRESITQGSVDVNQIRLLIENAVSRLLGRYAYSPSEDERVESRRKIGRYLLFSVFIGEIFPKLESELRRKEGAILTNRKDSHAAFEALKKAVLHISTQEVASFGADAQSGALGMGMKSALELCNSYMAHESSTTMRLNQGFYTAIDLVTSIAAALDMAFSRDFPKVAATPELLIKLHEDSFHIIIRLAMVDLRKLVHLQDDILISGSGTIARKISIVRDGDGYKVVPIDALADPYPQASLKEGPRIGCPAAVNFEGATVVKKMFDALKPHIKKTYTELCLARQRIAPPPTQSSPS